MTTAPSAFERLRWHKRSLALPGLGIALAVMTLALLTLNHHGPFSFLKAVYLLVGVIMLGVAGIVRGIRLGVFGLMILFVVSGM